jgi:hypothetical protein
MVNYFKKIKTIFKNIQLNQIEIKKLNAELIWAQIYHDSIRGNDAIESLNLNIGRWAGNYSFFYVLNRILNDYQPKSILELGLGESTKFISTFIKYKIPSCKHIIVEQNEDWTKEFNNRFILTNQSTILHCELENKIINNFDVSSYKKFSEKICDQFDLYVVDGPFGSDRYSRYDIIQLVEKFNNNDFIILFDDTHRFGELETSKQIISILNNKNIKNYSATYSGTKSVTVIASEKYKYSVSL